MRVGRIALVRRRLDAIDRQRGEQQRRAAERIAVAAEDGAAVALRRCAARRSSSAPADVACLGGVRPTDAGATFLRRTAFLRGGMMPALFPVLTAAGNALSLAVQLLQRRCTDSTGEVEYDDSSFALGAVVARAGGGSAGACATKASSPGDGRRRCQLT